MFSSGMSLDRMRNHLGSFTLQTAGLIRDNRIKVWARCDLCLMRQEVDIAALCQQVPWEFSLINRRCRCRLTADCQGWNVFEYRDGPRAPLLPLYDLKTQARWAGVALPPWPAFPKRF
jgi:hypothetical protein